MSDQFDRSGKGNPGQKADVARAMRAQGEIQKLNGLKLTKRCPCNPSLLVDCCAQCQQEEPGHGTVEVERQLATWTQELAMLNSSLRG